MVNRDPGLFARMASVWKTVDNEHKPYVAAIIGGAEHGHGALGISDFAGHTRAFVKVQDGCDAGCAYCIVPSVRGRPRSRPMGEVLDEIRRLAERFREVVLTGVHLGLYRDASGADLTDLVRAVLEATPVERLRLTSVEVNEITPALLDLAASSAGFCPHFHVPLQSGSDRVLERMNRRYTSGEFLGALGDIRARFDRPSVTSDVIVGFPGETDNDFAQTVGVCRAAEFSRMHIFRYSDRPGTAAEAMGGKCPASVITSRHHELGALAAELALAYKQQFVGRTVDVLVETSRDRSGRLCGYTNRYLRARFDGPDELGGRIVPVVVTGAEPAALSGDLAPENA
jgi:threonylcarbamoyladenosine tRNA methylthiotransferase MtaB